MLSVGIFDSLGVLETARARDRVGTVKMLGRLERDAFVSQLCTQAAV